MGIFGTGICVRVAHMATTLIWISYDIANPSVRRPTGLDPSKDEKIADVNDNRWKFYWELRHQL
jgi:hypothetical protein